MTNLWPICQYLVNQPNQWQYSANLITLSYICNSNEYQSHSCICYWYIFVLILPNSDGNKPGIIKSLTMNDVAELCSSMHNIERGQLWLANKQYLSFFPALSQNWSSFYTVRIEFLCRPLNFLLGLVWWPVKWVILELLHQEDEPPRGKMHLYERQHKCQGFRNTWQNQCSLIF